MRDISKSIDSAIELVEASFGEEMRQSMRSHSIVSGLQGTDDLYKKIAILEQYLANKRNVPDGSNSQPLLALEVNEILDSLIAVLEVDMHTIADETERAKGYRAQYEVCVCLELLPFDGHAECFTRAQEALATFVKNCQNDEIREDAQSTLTYLLKQLKP